MAKTQVFGSEKSASLGKELTALYTQPSLPDGDMYIELLKLVNRVFLKEDSGIRPYSEAGQPGGIIFLKQDIPAIIVPDLHSRMDFFLNIMFHTDSTGLSNLQKLGMNLLQIVCVGDGIHAEHRAYERWVAAFEEYKTGYEKHKSIDAEMKESLYLMAMVMKTKIAFPDNFHFLKGNHENIANEKEHGNHPFGKFAYEGPMVTHYVNKFYGGIFLNMYYKFEKYMPLLTVGKNFLVSHAEPRDFYDRDTLIEYRSHPEAVEGLTWTDNDAASEGSVHRMLAYYLNDSELAGSRYFAGHRTIKGMYKLRAHGKFVQIHNPDKFIVANINPGKEIDLDKDIMVLKDRTKEILENNKE